MSLSGTIEYVRERTQQYRKSTVTVPLPEKVNPGLTQPIAESPEQAVMRGIALLDYYSPGWEKKINLDTLSLESGVDCVVGQVFGHYGQKAVEWWGGHQSLIAGPQGHSVGHYSLSTNATQQAVRHGFEAPVWAGSPAEGYWTRATLASTWTDYIKARQ